VTATFQLAQRLEAAGQLCSTTRIVEAKPLADLRCQFGSVGDGIALQQPANIADALGFR
jgi:hypothetical protein